MQQEPAGKPLRFGIMCNGTTFAAWEAQCIRNLIDSETAVPVVLIIDKDYESHSGGKARLQKLKNLKNILWYLYSYFLVQPKSKALVGQDLSEELKHLPKLNCSVVTKGKFSQYFVPEDLDQIRAFELDFVLRFGFNIIRGEILSLPKYGVWSFHHDDEAKYRGGPACFWEIYHQDYVNGAILQRLTNRLDGGIVLKKGFFQTNLTSFAANRDYVYFESTIWPVQVCRDILNNVHHYFDAPPSSSSSAPIYYIPTNLQVIKFNFILLRQKLSKIFYALFYYWQWNIGIIEAPASELLNPRHKLPVSWLPAPDWNRFYADPFAVKTENGLTILFEDLDYRTDVGTISAYISRNNTFIRKDDVLKMNCHLSYPYLFEHDSVTYAIPETCGNREVALYKFFPEELKWERVCTLIENFPALDSSVIYRDGLWWLFATDKHDGPNHKLLIYHADKLTGPWLPHLNNPVKLDVRSARPAGTPFIHDGNWYRPAQNSSKSYGGSVVLNRIDILTKEAYTETIVNTIVPYSEYPDGLHTFSVAGDKVIIDGAKRKFIGGSIDLIKYKLKKLKQVVG